MNASHTKVLNRRWFASFIFCDHTKLTLTLSLSIGIKEQVYFSTQTTLDIHLFSTKCVWITSQPPSECSSSRWSLQHSSWQTGIINHLSGGAEELNEIIMSRWLLGWRKAASAARLCQYPGSPRHLNLSRQRTR